MWVLSQQVDASQLLLAGIGLVTVALGMWALGLTQRGAMGLPRMAALATSAVALIVSLSLIGGLTTVEPASVSAVARDGGRAVAAGEYPTEPFSRTSP